MDEQQGSLKSGNSQFFTSITSGEIQMKPLTLSPQETGERGLSASLRDQFLGFETEQ